MQVLATTLLSVHNLLNTHFAGPLQLKEFNFSYLLTLSAQAQEGYSSAFFVCLSVCENNIPAIDTLAPSHLIVIVCDRNGEEYLM